MKPTGIVQHRDHPDRNILRTHSINYCTYSAGKWPSFPPLRLAIYIYHEDGHVYFVVFIIFQQYKEKYL